MADIRERDQPGTVPGRDATAAAAARERAAPAARMPGKTRSPGRLPPCPGRCAGSAIPAGRTFRRRSRRPPRPCGGSPLSMPPSPAIILPRTVAPSPHSTPQHAELWNGPWPGSDSSEASSATAPIPVTSSSPLPAPRLRLGPGGPFPRPPLSAARCETPAPTANTGHSSRQASHGSTHPDRRLPLPHPHRHRQSQAWYCRTGPVSAYRGFPPCNASTALTRDERRRAGDCLASARGSVLPAPVLRIMRAHSRYLPSRRGNG